MRKITIEKTLYKFNELSEEVQKRVIEKYREGDDFSFEAQCVIDDAKEVGKLLGIDINKIYYSGFSSQGDGACFEGSYRYRKNCVKETLSYAPVDIGLHNTVHALFELQRKNKYNLRAIVKQRGHYNHAYCTDINVYRNDGRAVDDKTEAELITLLRYFMDWIYRALETQYDYVNSQACIMESIECNDYEFTAEGKIECHV